MAVLLRTRAPSCGAARLQPVVDAFGRVAPVAHAPDHERGAAHDVAAREHALQRRHHGLPVDPHGAPAGHRELGLAEQRRQIFRIEAQRLDHEVGLDREARAGDRLRPLPAARVRRAKAHPDRAHRARPGRRPGRPRAPPARRTRPPPPRRASPRASSPACWPGRAGRGTAPRRAPWRTAVRTQSIAVSPPPTTTTRLPAALSAPESNAGTASPSPLRLLATR